MATVMLDAGHGGTDAGATYEGRREKDDTLKLVLAVGNILEDRGVNVLYTRTTDVYQTPREKADIANRSDAAYFISLHRNSTPSPNTYSGVQTLVYENEGIPALFVENINRELEEAGFANLGVLVQKNIAVLRRTDMPAALVEVGYINTDADNELFDVNFDGIAQAIANGILDTIQGENVSSNEIRMYAIETGTFHHYENADMLARNMQKNGLPCYIEPINRSYRVLHGRYSDYHEADKVQKRLFELGYEARIIVIF